MKIYGREHAIAVVMLMMEHEFDDTKRTIATLVNAGLLKLNRISLSILLNGSSNKKIEEYFASIPNVFFYSSLKNLGVAGGRNFLFTRPEVIGSDIVVSLDNDLFLPTDFIERMVKFLLDHPDAGLVGPTLIWTHFFSHRIPDKITDISVPVFTSNDLRREWIKNGNGDAFYFLGTHSWLLSDCLATPTSIQNLFLLLKRKGILRWAPYVLLHADPRVIDRMRGGIPELPVQTISGGAAVFFSSILCEVGLLEPAYSPYGHEDHEFSVRVLKQGYVNYADPHTFALHGLATRQPTRDHAWIKYQNARRRAITTRKTIGNRTLRWLIIIEIFLHTLITSFFSNILSRRFTFPSLASGIRGWFEGATVRLTDDRTLIERARKAKKSAGRKTSRR